MPEQHRFDDLPHDRLGDQEQRKRGEDHAPSRIDGGSEQKWKSGGN